MIQDSAIGWLRRRGQRRPGGAPGLRRDSVALLRRSEPAPKPTSEPWTAIGAALRMALRATLILGFAAVLFSQLWVGLYAVIDPPSTWLMRERRAAEPRFDQIWVPLDAQIAPVARALVAAEDARFCAHNGADLQAMADALAANQRGGRLRGGSTITQQTAKNAFLWPERSYLRKALELWFSALIEISWSKRRTLEIYLNIAETGPGAFGVEAAARRFFGRPAADLSPAQAAAIAAALPSPRTRRPNALNASLRRRARAIAQGAGDLAYTGRDGCFAPRGSAS